MEIHGLGALEILLLFNGNYPEINDVFKYNNMLTIKTISIIINITKNLENSK